MTDCCTADSNVDGGVASKVDSAAKPKTSSWACPRCGQRCHAVAVKTMLHHVKQIWTNRLTEQQYYYCHAAGCDVVYFAKQSNIFTKDEIRTLIGTKEQSEDALICFCFGVSKGVAAEDKNVKDFVIKQTKASLCSCATSNPSGRCCLKDFPKTI